MRIKYHKDFAKNYKNRIGYSPKLTSQFRKQLNNFVRNSKDPSLRDHKLIGRKKSFRAFSITGDIRVVYKIIDDEIWLYDIGSHNQVY